MGPLEKTKPWSSAGTKGVFNFLSRVHRFFLDKTNYTKVWFDADTEEKEDDTYIKIASVSAEKQINLPFQIRSKSSNPGK